MTADDVPGRDELRVAYLESVVEIALPTGTLLLEPAPHGSADGAFPSGISHLHVITACNPRSRVLDDTVNAARNASLVADLDAAGLIHVAAVGRSPDGAWQEPSRAVLDADEDLVLDLATRYEQHAVYAWSPREWAVVWTGPHRGERDVLGWRVRT